MQELHVLVAKNAVGRSLVPEMGHLFVKESALVGKALDGEYVGVVLRGLVRWLQLGAVPVGPESRSPDWDGGQSQPGGDVPLLCIGAVGLDGKSFVKDLEPSNGNSSFTCYAVRC